MPWPEDHFSLSVDASNRKDWTVFPLMYTFPAYDESKKTWVNSTCQWCPKTAALLRQIPNTRTALFSKLGPNTNVRFALVSNEFCFNLYFPVVKSHWMG